MPSPRLSLLSLLLIALTLPAAALAAPPPSCRTALIEGELEAGKAFTQPLGNGLTLAFQPIASGWILRIWPAGGPRRDPDLAQVATPPYHSVTPLSLSTDFAFRAQDAAGWNPRHFRFATSLVQYERMLALYHQLSPPGQPSSPAVESALASAAAQASQATLTLLDVRLEAGTADQWKGAATVASHLTRTAHTLVEPASGAATPLGRLLWVRFRVALELPPAFAAAPGLHLLPHLCDSGSQPDGTSGHPSH